MRRVMMLLMPDVLSVHLDNQEIAAFPLGQSQLLSVLKSSPPTPYELEVGIELLENAFMPLLSQLESESGFVATGAGFESLGHALHKSILMIDEVENCFVRLAEVSEGYPPVLEPLPTDSDFYMQILILREFMHHLKFDEVEI